MAVQNRADVTNVAFILAGSGRTKEAETVAQDGGRSGDLLVNTLMSYNPTDESWQPFNNEASTDGTQFPRGIIQQTIAEADLIAGDVTDVPILVGGVILDEQQLVIENSKTLATIINEPANLNTSVRDFLQMVGITIEETIDIDEFEN